MDPKNWDIWAQIEPCIKDYCDYRWHEPATAADVLSGGREIFVNRHTGGGDPLPRLIMFGRLCCRWSARKQGFSRAREVCGWEQLPEVVPTGYRRGRDHLADLAELSGLDADFLRRESRLQQLEQAVGSWAAGGDLEQLVRLHLGGMTSRVAAQKLGCHPSQVTRRLQDLGRKLGAVPRSRRQQDGEQMSLFVGQGV